LMIQSNPDVQSRRRGTSGSRPAETDFPENGVIGKLPAPSLPLGEFTENQTLQELRRMP
jgi:hypothetical protein